MVTVVFEDSYNHRPLRMFRRWHQLHIKNGARIYLYCKNEEDCGWYEVCDQRFGIGRSLINRVTQFFTLSPVSSM